MRKSRSYLSPGDYPKIYLYRRVVQAKLFIDAHYDQKIDLRDIADEAYFSKFHFTRLFKTIYNKTPHQYLISVRIERSKLLLAEGMPVSAACFTVGFESAASFSALFKRIAGMAPAAYSRQQVARKAEIKKIPLKYIPNCFAENKGWTKKSNIR